MAKLEQAKEHYLNESTDLGFVDEETIQQLATWLEENGYDGDGAYTLWESYRDELTYRWELAFA